MVARIFYSIILIALFLGLGSCRPPEGAEQGSAAEALAAEQLVGGGRGGGELAVEVQLVAREGFFGALESSGVIRGIQEATVVSETSGAIQAVRVRLGQTVSRGQVLATLDNSLERFAVAQARDQLAVAEIEFAATQQLFDNGNSSAAALARSKAAVSGGRSVLAQAQRQLSNRIITAPINGRMAVIPGSISEGNFIQPGTTIARIVNMGSVRIDIGLGEREIQMISVGDRTRVYSDACGLEPQEATVRGLAAGSAEQSGSFTVRIEFPNRCGPQLKSGMTARIEINNANQEETIVIPTRALLSEDEDDFVFIAMQDGDAYFAQRRPIEIARVLGDRVEVKSGLEEQDILIVAPVQILQDGAEINPTTIRG